MAARWCCQYNTYFKMFYVGLDYRYVAIKGTRTVYFSCSVYTINQKPMIPRTHFHCITTWVASSSG